MKLWIDSANIETVREAFASGIVTGITTNPALIAKEPPHPAGYYGHLRSLIRATSAADIPISVQPAIEDLRASPKEHLGLIKGSLQSRGVIVKIAASWENLPLIRAIASTGTPVNATCIFTSEQAIAAIAAGARYVSLFWCRMNDVARDNQGSGHNPGGEEAEKSARRVRTLIDSTNSTVQIIAGSIRTSADALSAFVAGAHIVTTGLPVLKALATNDLSAASAEGFEKARKDWDEKVSLLAEQEASWPVGQDHEQQPTDV